MELCVSFPFNVGSVRVCFFAPVQLLDLLEYSQFFLGSSYLLHVVHKKIADVDGVLVVEEDDSFHDPLTYFGMDVVSSAYCLLTLV